MFALTTIYAIADYLFESSLAYLFPSSRDVLELKLQQYWKEIELTGTSTMTTGVQSVSGKPMVVKLSKVGSQNNTDEPIFEKDGIALKTIA